MLKRYNTPLPDWIAAHASIGPNVKVDATFSHENAFWYCLTAKCPLIFESYAIVLHPYWINLKVKDLVAWGFNMQEENIDDEDFKRISWQAFFNMEGRDFDFQNAYKIKEEIHSSFKEWPSYLWAPGEGSCEEEELIFILNTIESLYGDVASTFHFNLFNTVKWENEITYTGKISDFNEVLREPKASTPPSLIFSDDKNWCIISDWDMAFTYVGGSAQLIDSISQHTEFEIFRIEPRYDRL